MPPSHVQDQKISSNTASAPMSSKEDRCTIAEAMKETNGQESLQATGIIEQTNVYVEAESTEKHEKLTKEKKNYVGEGVSGISPHHAADTIAREVPQDVGSMPKTLAGASKQLEHRQKDAEAYRGSSFPDRVSYESNNRGTSLAENADLLVESAGMTAQPESNFEEAEGDDDRSDLQTTNGFNTRDVSPQSKHIQSRAAVRDVLDNYRDTGGEDHYDEEDEDEEPWAIEDEDLDNPDQQGEHPYGDWGFNRQPYDQPILEWGVPRGLSSEEPGTYSRCIVCWDSLDGVCWENYVRLRCGEAYCVECVNEVFKSALQFESNFPPLCGCKLPILLEETRRLLAQEHLDRYDNVVPEWTSVHRTYFANCLQYLDSQRFTEDTRYSECSKCNESTCRDCKASKIQHEDGCPADLDRERLLELGTSNNWKQCSQCGNLIEKNQGCDHMTCICGHDFCYICGHDFCYICGFSPYGTHDCIGNVTNGNAFPCQALEWPQYVINDDGEPVCQHATFAHSPGGGRCEGVCGHFLGLYLNRCDGCGLRVCNYCRGDRAFLAHRRPEADDEDEVSEAAGQDAVEPERVSGIEADDGEPSLVDLGPANVNAIFALVGLIITGDGEGVVHDGTGADMSQQ
jgi:hypothetical protein